MLRKAIARHYRKTVGEPSDVYWFEDEDGRIEVWHWEPDDTGFHAFATLGACERLAGCCNSRVEFHMGLLASPDGLAESLANFAVEGMGNNTAPVPCQIFTLPEPLWAGTEAQSLLVFPEDDEERVLAPFPHKGTTVDFLWLVPVFRNEVDLVKEQSAGALLARFEEQETEFWDPYRVPTPA